MSERTMSSVRERIAEKIAEHGHTVIWTPVDLGKVNVNMAYTIGNTDHDVPEIICFGLPKEHVQQILTDAVRRMRAGELEMDVANHELCNIPIQMSMIDPEFITVYMTQALNYYKDTKTVKAAQLIWSDEKGIFPWQAGFNPSLVAFQPPLAPNVGKPTAKILPLERAAVENPAE